MGGHHLLVPVIVQGHKYLSEGWGARDKQNLISNQVEDSASISIYAGSSCSMVNAAQQRVCRDELKHFIVSVDTLNPTQIWRARTNTHSNERKHNELLVPKHNTALNLFSIFSRPSWNSWCPGERQDGKGEENGSSSTYWASGVSVGLCFVSLTSVGRMCGDFHLTGDGWDMALSWSSRSRC